MKTGKPSLNATTYAILGLIAAQHGSAYELVRRMQNNYRYFWPRAQSNYYSAIKLLVSAGLATATDEGKGQRPRTVYRATPKGRAELSGWLATAAAAPSFEFEGLLRVVYADFGSKPQLLKQLRLIRENALAVMAAGAAIASDYAAARVALPQRAHTSQLLWQFLWSQHRTLADWATWAIRQVEKWPDTKASAANQAQAARFFRRAAATSRTKAMQKKKR